MEETVHTRRVSAGSRVYYFDVHKDKKGQKYLAISEIPKDHPPFGKARHRVFVHEENLERFSEAISEVIEAIKNET